MLSIGDMILYFVVFIFSLTLHEVGHAWVSEKFGDPTGRFMGRITLNPLPHIDPIGTILFPLIGMLTGVPLFGWAKPVIVDARYWRNKVKADICVSMAGPAANIIIATFSLIIFKALIFFKADLGSFNEAVIHLLLIAITVNVALAIFNLIPIPPLDGSHVMRHLLGFFSPDLEDSYLQLQPYGFMILMGLMYLGVFRMILNPIMGLVYFILKM